MLPLRVGGAHILCRCTYVVLMSPTPNRSCSLNVVIAIEINNGESQISAHPAVPGRSVVWCGTSVKGGAHTHCILYVDPQLPNTSMQCV